MVADVNSIKEVRKHIISVLRDFGIGKKSIEGKVYNIRFINIKRFSNLLLIQVYV